MESGDDMKLEQCTKAELLEIIKKSLPSWEIEPFLLKFEMDRIHARHNKSDELCNKAKECINQRAKMLEPYEGRKISDIPMSVLKKADALAAEAWNCQCRAARISGIKLKDGE